MTDTFTVEGVTNYIASLLKNDPPLRDLWVRGEVSQISIARSGHWYFNIKDENATLKCVMFRSDVARQSFQPHDGEAIRVHGRIDVYQQRGEYQLYADQVQPAGGVGQLYQQYELLKTRLAQEGLFDQERKRPLPLFPLRIGVVTSPDAAAFRDIQNVLARRFPLAQIVLSPTLVQGAEAPPQIVAAIERINRHQAADVLLIARGGGSIEDLWAFNDEAVARAIAASPIPTISGVGHETDVTIADFVADVRAPTPSAAAEIAVPDQGELRQALVGQVSQLERILRDTINRRRADLDSLQRRLAAESPERFIREMRQRLDDRAARMTSHQRQHLSRLRERLSARVDALEKANPDALLKRGYAIVTRRDDGTPVTRAAGIDTGTQLTLRLQDGTLQVQVTQEENDND